MKKSIAVIAISSSLLSASVFAAQYGVAGCGLGSELFSPGSGQIFASTTNGTVLNQSFGITSGTSNCTDDAHASAEVRIPRFVAINKVNLADDISRGGGETVENLAAIMGCEKPASVGSKLQQNFQAIFPDPTVTTDRISDQILAVVRQDAELAVQCKQIG